jgi:hypothetical protein
VTLDRILAVIGLIIAIPGFLLLFFTDHQTESILTVGLGLVVLGAGAIDFYLSRLPPYTINDAKVIVDFPNGDRRIARITKSYTVRPNFGHLNTMTHRNIGAQGTVQNLCWNGLPIQQIRQSLGEYEVTIDFNGPHKRFRPFTGALSYEAVDSFKGNPEWFCYVIDFPIKAASIEVNLPTRDPCKSAEAFRVEGNGRTRMPDPDISADKQRLSWKLNRPRRSAEYRLYWYW